MTRTGRLAAGLRERGADAFVATQRPNQLYLLAERQVMANELGDPPPYEQLAARLAAMRRRRVVFDRLPDETAQTIGGAVECVEDDFVTAGLCRAKDERDIAGPREAARVADLGMQTALCASRSRLTCAEAIAEGTAAVQQAGGGTAGRRRYSRPAAMLRAGAESAAMAPASGVGTCYLDSAEDPRRVIREGEMMYIDLGIWVDGYLGDTGHPTAPGSPDAGGGRRRRAPGWRRSTRPSSSTARRRAGIAASSTTTATAWAWGATSCGCTAAARRPVCRRCPVVRAGVLRARHRGRARGELILVRARGPEELTRTPMDRQLGL